MCIRDSGLVETRTIMQIQAVLIANRAAYHLKRAAVEQVLDRLRTYLAQRD